MSYTEEFICSVALGYDIVPRLGLVEVIQLRIDILNAIKNCTLPKVNSMRAITACKYIHVFY